MPPMAMWSSARTGDGEELAAMCRILTLPELFVDN